MSLKHDNHGLFPSRPLLPLPENLMLQNHSATASWERCVLQHSSEGLKYAGKHGYLTSNGYSQNGLTDMAGSDKVRA